MAGGFTGDPKEFTQAEGRVVEATGRMNKNLSDLRSNIEATRAGWEGDAQRAFDNVMRRFDECGRGLNDALHHIGTLLQEGGSMYAKSEAAQHEHIQSLNKGFGVLG
jgi:WXG100 family type VII secretion target